MSEDAHIRRANLRALRLHPARLAELTNKSPNYFTNLLNSEKKSFGEKTARAIEQAIGLPPKWLDEPHEQAPAAKEPDPHYRVATASPQETALAIIGQSLAGLDQVQRMIVGKLLDAFALSGGDTTYAGPIISALTTADQVSDVESSRPD